MSEHQHDANRCRLCAPLRHPAGRAVRKALAENPLPGARTSSENGGVK